MLTVALASSTAALFGVADFLGGLASRRESAVAVTASAHGLGLLVFLAALVLFPAPFSQVSVLAGLSAGVCSGIGVACLFSALARGRMSVVAPLTAALSGSIPAAYDFGRGADISPTSLVGLALAVAATVIVSATAGKDENGAASLPPMALALSMIAGLGFAGSFLSFSFAAENSGFWPLAASRTASFAMLGLVSLALRGRLSIDQAVRPAAFGSGLLDAAANFTMVSAIRVGPLAVASVLGSLYPVVTVLLARMVLGERLRGLQRVGVGLAFVAVLLTAWR